ncbi:hypothetical protein [Sphingomonas sp. Leaf339]|uniref:hypothetical protein n=1 Tax=Sphingomonas sp. Leaf339 TaxID=1736343 RepID=UPI0012E398C5|nr:hypothetical protein [Sphingomonas sp. Leaf339]
MCAGSVAAQTYVVHRVDRGQMKGYDTLDIAKAAVPGEKVRLWFATMTNPDCSSAGTMTTQVLTGARHGQVDISYDKVFPNFAFPNPRVACDRQKVDGVQAFYTAAADFHGRDKVVLQNATSEGRIRRIVIDINVR